MTHPKRFYQFPFFLFIPEFEVKYLSKNWSNTFNFYFSDDHIFIGNVAAISANTTSIMRLCDVFFPHLGLISLKATFLILKCITVIAYRLKPKEGLTKNIWKVKMILDQKIYWSWPPILIHINIFNWSSTEIYHIYSLLGNFIKKIKNRC